MNIETLTVEFIRTGRHLAGGVLHDDALRAGLPTDVLPILEKLRDRTCRPSDALIVMVPTQKALEEERVAVQRQLDAFKEISRKREEARSRLVQLRIKKEMCALFEAATHDLLDHRAAGALLQAYVETSS